MQLGGHHVKQDKEFKISYQVNLLPSMSEEDGMIIDAIANSNDLDIFTTDVVQDLIGYKWK